MAATARYQTSRISFQGTLPRGIAGWLGVPVLAIGLYGPIAVTLSQGSLSVAQLCWYSLVLALGGLLGGLLGRQLGARGRSLLARSAPLTGAVAGVMLGNLGWLVLSVMAALVV